MIISASCSIDPDSRRSDSIGRRSVRDSTPRLSCARATTGICNSLFMANYRESNTIARKRISFDLLYNLVEHILETHTPERALENDGKKNVA